MQPIIEPLNPLSEIDWRFSVSLLSLTKIDDFRTVATCSGIETRQAPEDKFTLVYCAKDLFDELINLMQGEIMLRKVTTLTEQSGYQRLRKA